MQLIQDVFIMENLQIIEEGSSNTKMKIRGTFQRAEEANNNGRIYPTKVLEGQITKLQPLIEARRLCGELDHPQNDTVKLSNASHLVTKLEMKGNEVLGEAEILKTPAGLTAQALVHGGVSIGISSRGMGTLSEDAQGAKIVNEDFNLVTFDLVADPSTRGAYPSLAESKESQFVKTTQGKLQKESNFITMLEAKMRDAYQPWIEEAMTGKGDTAAARKSDRERADKDRKARRAKAQPMEDAFELVKADGHWHRIAEAIAVAMGHEIDEGIKDVVKGAHEKVRKFLGKNVHPSLHSKKEKKAKAKRKATRDKGWADTEASNKKLRAEKPARDAKERTKIKAKAKAMKKDYPKHQPGKHPSLQDPKYAAPGEDLPGMGSRHRKVDVRDHTEYHRMGYMITESLASLEAHDKPEEAENVNVRHSGRVKGKEGMIGRALRQRSERKHAEKSAKGMAIAKAKGEAAGSKIAGKTRRGEALKDVKAKGAQSREGIKQATKTHGKREKAKSAKGRSTMAGKEQRAFDKTASPLKRGTSHTTRAVHGATRDAVEKAVEKTGQGISKGAEGLGRAAGKAGRFLKARANSAKKPPLRSGK